MFQKKVQPILVVFVLVNASLMSIGGLLFLDMEIENLNVTSTTNQRMLQEWQEGLTYSVLLSKCHLDQTEYASMCSVGMGTLSKYNKMLRYLQERQALENDTWKRVRPTFLFLQKTEKKDMQIRYPLGKYPKIKKTVEALMLADFENTFPSTVESVFVSETNAPQISFLNTNEGHFVIYVNPELEKESQGVIDMVIFMYISLYQSKAVTDREIFTRLSLDESSGVHLVEFPEQETIAMLDSIFMYVNASTVNESPLETLGQFRGPHMQLLSGFYWRDIQAIARGEDVR